MYKTEEYQALTLKEFEALRYLHNGLSNPEIALKMCITVATVKVHISNILHKFGARNRVDVLLMLAGQKEIKNSLVKEQITELI